MDTLVSTEWLAHHLDDPNLVVLDCSVRTEQTAEGFTSHSGRENWARGHIPGATFADLTGDLADSDNPLDFSLPAPKDFCAAMGLLGVGDHSHVVLYDNSGMMWAARVWWMLRWIGFDRAAVLDGGLGAWTAEGRPLSTDPPSYPVRELTPHLRPRVIADRDEVDAATGTEAVGLIDTLPAESFRGEMAPYGRGGHIPTAINVCGMDLLDPTGHLSPRSELVKRHQIDPDRRWITYCGGGILASLSAFAMTRLGFDDVAVYIGSLQEWAADSANPMVTGEG